MCMKKSLKWSGIKTQYITVSLLWHKQSAPWPSLWVFSLYHTLSNTCPRRAPYRDSVSFNKTNNVAVFQRVPYSGSWQHTGLWLDSALPLAMPQHRYSLLPWYPTEKTWRGHGDFLFFSMGGCYTAAASQGMVPGASCSGSATLNSLWRTTELGSSPAYPCVFAGPPVVEASWGGQAPLVSNISCACNIRSYN